MNSWRVGLRAAWPGAFLLGGLTVAPAVQAQEQPPQAAPASPPSEQPQPQPSPEPAQEQPVPAPASSAPAKAPEEKATEAKTPEQKAAPAKPDESKSRTIDRFINQTFANDTETRSHALAAERRFFAERVEEVLGQFVDVGGYFRAGYARDGEGGPMAAFRAPGATTKYRLGNEAENYGELIIGKSFYMPGTFHLDDNLRADGSPAGPVARVQLRISFVNGYESSNTASATSVGLPEAWASIGNVLPFSPDAKVWAGNRFYRRHDIHVVDFFFWNMSGGGGGVEDVKIGPAKLAFAWIGLGSTSGLSYVPQPDPTNVAGYSKSSWELRIYDLPLGPGTLEAGITYAHSASGLDSAGRQAPDSHGVAFNVVHSIPKFLAHDGLNKLSLQYGTGAARTFTSGFETFTQAGASYIRPEETGSYRLRATESFTTNLGPYFSLGPVLVFETSNFSDGTGQKYWVSAGARPIVHFNQYLNIAVEGGIDWTKDEGTNVSGALYKLTFAPQVAVANRFASRPVIRAFCTLATWNDSFVGQVGGVDYAASNSGMNLGAQMEAWW